MNDQAKRRLPKSDVVINDVSFINQTGNQVNKGGKRDYLDGQRSSKTVN